VAPISLPQLLRGSKDLMSHALKLGMRHTNIFAAEMFRQSVKHMTAVMGSVLEKDALARENGAFNKMRLSSL
jgi:hypothetical protein